MNFMDIFRPSEWDWNMVARAEAKEEEAHKQKYEAMAKLGVAEEQAERLRRMDTRNHYSQSLTESFRRKP